MARKSLIPGLSFSLNRALGISSMKASISRKIGVSLTESGRRAKVIRTLSLDRIIKKCFK